MQKSTFLFQEAELALQAAAGEVNNGRKHP